MNIYLTSTATAIPPKASEKCTRCGNPWTGIQIDHLLEYKCRCGYSARVTFGGLGDYSEECARAVRTLPSWLD